MENLKSDKFNKFEENEINELNGITGGANSVYTKGHYSGDGNTGVWIPGHEDYSSSKGRAASAGSGASPAMP